MEKVWFKLRQTHYPPGPESAILAGRGDDTNSPIALGHCVPDLKHLDFPLNSGAILPFPARMRVFRASTIDFKWDATRTTSLGLGVAAGAPLAVALGLLTVRAGVQVAFERSVAEHEKYTGLDTYFVQPNRRYVEDCLKTAEMQRYVGGHASWSFFMVTGIRVAREGSRSVEEAARADGVHVTEPVSSDVPTIATLELTGEVGRENARGVEEGQTSSFVWAVRLAKVHKGILSTDWSIDPYTHKATFGADSEGQQVDVAAVVTGHGLQGFKVVEDEELDEAIVLDASDWEEAGEEQFGLGEDIAS
ncbi:hypothetical protein C8A01DRAFT_14397 [Parachaetomium inaequale]|uniref:Uncharacterized protein n=1 Tax=Parachaetomium inaequale TaxID=2588326 RepID=A0AAN6PJH1_9PEZI|nr:hypothetical protein C8A01DRAFT_14397 [Parachaetomium inaequale]